jgi:hypothetical protein
VVDATAQRTVIPIGQHDLLVRSGPVWVLCPADDPIVLKNLIDPCDRERALRRTIERAAGPGATVVDGVAGPGAIALAAAHAVGTGGRVIAVESDPGAAVRLRRSIELNDLGAVAEVRPEFGELSLEGGQRVVLRTEASAASLARVLDVCDGVGDRRSTVVVAEFGTDLLKAGESMVQRWLGEMTTRGFRWRLIDPSTSRLSLVGADEVTRTDACVLLFARPDDIAELSEPT